MRLKSSERETQNAILELLRLEGIFALRLNSGAVKVEGRFVRFHSGGSGVADIVAFPRMRPQECKRAGLDTLGYAHALWIEVKTEKGRQSPEQESFEADMCCRGMYYLLARSLDDVTAWLREHR